MFGPGGSSANLSPFFFVLYSLMFIREEQVEVLDDDKLVLVINRFKQFYEGMVDKRNY